MDSILTTIPTIRHLTVQIPNQPIPTESLKYWNNLLSLNLKFVDFQYILNSLTYAMSDFQSQTLQVLKFEFCQFPGFLHSKPEIEMFELCIGQMKNLQSLTFTCCMKLVLSENLLKGLYKSMKFGDLKI
jgi:hypothetical protein